MDNPFTNCSNYYKSLPVLDAEMFQGDFSWMPDLPESLETYSMMEDHTDYLKGLIEAAAGLEHVLPESFVRFFKTPEFQSQMISNMDSYFELSEHMIPSPFGDGGHFIEFMHDVQDIAHWSLYLGSTLGHRVVQCPFHIDQLPLNRITRDDIFIRTHVCSPSFEEFIYRTWIENMIWVFIDNSLLLTDEMDKYMSGWKRGTGSDE